MKKIKDSENAYIGVRRVSTKLKHTIVVEPNQKVAIYPSIVCCFVDTFRHTFLQFVT